MGGRAKPLLLFVVLIAGLLLLVRVGPGRVPPRGAEPFTRIEGADYPLLLIDPVGGRRELSRPPQRVVSMTLGSDEMLLDLVPPGRIAALTRNVDDPRQSVATERARGVGARVTGNAEEILAAEPDLVLIASWSRADQVKLLARSGVPVYRMRAVARMSDLKENLLALARLCGVRPAGEALWRRIEGRLDRIRRTLPPTSGRPRALFLTRDLWTGGSGTTVQIALTHAGARNVAALQGIASWRRLSREEVLAWDPDVVILQTSQGGARPAHDWLAGQPGLASLRAVRQRRVWAVPARNLSSVSHHLIGAVEILHRLLYPERAR